MPHDLPPWGTVHYYYRRLRLDGTWIKIHGIWRGRVRQKAGRKVNPNVQKKQGFLLLPRRWVVARTFAWLDNYRRLSKDYEQLPQRVVAPG